jgi:DNA-directed RNA polymerase subunit RPC12/RpoP
LTETPKIILKESKNNEDEIEHCNTSERSWRKERFLEKLSLFDKKKINDYELSKLKTNTISKKKKARCPECKKEMSGQSAIAKHLLSHRPQEEWPYSCILCGKKFQVNSFF